MKRTILMTSIIAASLALTACGTMGDRDGGPRGQRGHGNDAMRQVAAAACQGKSEGAQVSLTNPKGQSMSAVCMMTPKGELSAMPEQMVARIKAAKQACVDKAAGDSVQIADFKDASKTMDATCTQHGDALYAHPKNMGKGWDKNRSGMKAPAQAN